MDALLVERHEMVAVVTLNRPDRRNALTAELMVGIAATMTQLDQDPAVGAIILTGADPAFCAGLDLAELSADAGNLRVDETGRPWPRLHTPVIGAINGAAATGGLELVLHCDFALASDRARFADTHARVGVMPGWGLSVLLPQAVGLRRAKQMSLTGNYVSASDAAAWGLVTAVVPHEELLPSALGLAQDVCSVDRHAAATLLALYDDNAGDQIASGLHREYVLAREWRDGVFTSGAIAARSDAVRERGRNQVSAATEVS
jgi:enoyl-CoA hydratase